MDFLYNTGIRAYRLAAKIASVKNRKAKLMLNGQSRTFDLLREKIEPGRRYIWMHAASLGEFEQGRPLIEKIKKENPRARIVLSFFSPSGYEVRKHYEMVDVVCYLPFDLPGNVTRFLDLVNPSVAIFVKYEFWGNYLNELRRRGVPTFIVSAVFRPKQVFFRPWGRMFRKMLGCYDNLFVQDERSRELLERVGISNVDVCGDTRFDRVMDVRNAARTFPLIERFAKRGGHILVAGSSWQPDEDLIFPYFNSHPHVRLIIAPHEFDKPRLMAMMSRMSRPAVLFSQLTEKDADQAQCIVIDSFGLLSSIYRYGTIAYVGGGFGAGIHNLNEAAVYGLPVIFGPRHEKFREARGLIECGAGLVVNDNSQFDSVMNHLTDDPEALRRSGNAAAEYIKNNTGATQHIFDKLKQHLL